MVLSASKVKEVLWAAHNGINEGVTTRYCWRRIRRIKGPTTYNLILWFLQHGKLPTAALIHPRVQEVNPLCTFCKTKMDTNLHVIRDCEWFLDVWERLLLPRQCNKSFDEEIWLNWLKLTYSKTLDMDIMEWIGFLFTEKLSSLFGIVRTKCTILKIEKCPQILFVYDIVHYAKFTNLASHSSNSIARVISGRPASQLM